ncbi:MAG: hypothetical protein O7C75_19400, partial [Verrucomicrobia bacterium]|nr:hypothetical protein [Verrucomicrobiota bacterium]
MSNALDDPRPARPWHSGALYPYLVIGTVLRTGGRFCVRDSPLIPLFTKNATVAEWILGWSKAAALDWAQALARAANAAPAPKPSVPLGCAPYGSSQRSALLQVSRYSQ